MKSMREWLMLGVKVFLIGCLVVMLGACSLSDRYDANGSESAHDVALLEKIKEAAKALEVKPVDAKLDSVWKAIPGYNGIVVDVEKTYYYARKLKGSNIPFVYKEIEPRISLDQIGAEPIYKGNPLKPMVAIMVNVAWGNEFIPSILETLEQENVHLTFFLDGTWLKNNVEIAKQIQDKGHEMSNHAYSHKNMGDLGWEEAKEEILKTEALLKQELDVDNAWFAPPSGHFDNETVKLAHELNLKTVLWTLDTLDWKNPGPAWIVKKIAMAVEPGSLILMHPTTSSSAALPAMIKEIKSRGLMIGTVSDTLSSARIFEVESDLDLW